MDVVGFLELAPVLLYTLPLSPWLVPKPGKEWKGTKVD
jgi:hypothetical protein